MKAKLLLTVMAALCFFTAPVLAAQLQVVHGHVPVTVSRLKLQPTGHLSSAQTLQLNFMLPPRDLAGLQSFLKELQNPASTNYHRYLTPAQFDERFAPAEADYQAVIQFARSQGFTVKRTVPGRTLVEVEGTVAVIERAMHVNMRLYDHPTEGRQFYAPDAEPTLDLNVPLADISGLDNFTLPRTRVQVIDQIKMSSLNANPAAATKIAGTHNGTGSYTNFEDLFMGNDFRNSFASDTSLNGSGQVAGVLEWDSFTPADIHQYETSAGLPNVNVVEIRIGVTQNLNNGDLEVPLDIDMVMSIAPSVSEIEVFHGNNYDSILTEAGNPTQGEPLPLQIGCSIFTSADANTPNLLARFAAQGQSFFYASGDIGAFPVEPSTGGVYISGEGSTDTQDYMVSAGGTHLVMNNNGASYNSESVWPGSSGGYQTPLSLPPFQMQINMASLGGSTVYRNVPDVSAPADNILVFCSNSQGQFTYNVGGTSCAAPLWAGFATLVNQEAQADGKPSLGYANPALYAVGLGPQYPFNFHDVTSGNNTNSRSPTLFFAATGYDLCTGWGSPRGQTLIDSLVFLSGPIFVDFNYTGATQNGNYETPFKTLAQGVSAVSSHGTIFFKTAGTSTETLTITKPMVINASDGAATVGQ